MLIKPALLYAGLCLAAFIKPQTGGNEFLWTRDYHLKWEDFRMQPENRPDTKAMTNSGIRYKYTQVGDTMYINIYSYFDATKSWVVESSKTNSNLLAHEQGHFDITEIYARLLRKKVATTKFSKANLKTEFRKIYEENRGLWDYEQDSLYDKQTNHSKNEISQAEWSKTIAKRLEELKGYDKISMSIKLQ